MQTENSKPADGAPDAADPIIAAIAAYRAGLAEYGRDGDESNECANRTYVQPLGVLIAWAVPVQTEEGALEALRLAVQELEMGLVDVPASMVRVALGFFEEAA